MVILKVDVIFFKKWGTKHVFYMPVIDYITDNNFKHLDIWEQFTSNWFFSGEIFTTCICRMIFPVNA